MIPKRGKNTMGSASKRHFKHPRIETERDGRSVGKPGTYTNVVTNQEVQDEEDEKMAFIMDAVTAVLSYHSIKYQGSVVKAEAVAKLFSVPLIIIENVLWENKLREVRPGLWTWKDTAWKDTQKRG